MVITNRLGSSAASEQGKILAETDAPLRRAHPVINHRPGTSQTPGKGYLTRGIASFFLTASHVLVK